MAEYSSSFQINDIILNIPPKKIRVDRQTLNRSYQTLRTQSSTKIKTGFSIADIHITAEFTDDVPLGAPLRAPNGLQQLRDLISQFRVTPFCYVENELLRDEFMGGNRSKSMALALKQMEIIKGAQPSETNVVTVNFHFCWFNYSPFSRDFAFKQNIFGSTSTKNPINSKPWELLYSAEQKRHDYAQIASLQTGLTFRFKQYKAMTIKRYREVRDKELEALQRLSSEIYSFSDQTEGFHTINRIRDLFGDILGDENWARSLRREVLGDTTSMFYEPDSKNIISKVKQLLDEALDPQKRDARFAAETFGWRPVTLRDGSYLEIPKEPADTKKNQTDNYKEEETILLVRDQVLDFNEEQLIVQGITISFENILATLPLTGHPYPSYQHIGSIDANISFSIVTPDQKSLGRLTSFFDMVEQQHHSNRNIPDGHKNIHVENDLVNMCGIRECMNQAFSTENIEGEPGSYSAILSLVDNPITTSTQEHLSPGQSFSTSQDLRVAIAKILEKKLAFKKDLWETSSNGTPKLKPLVKDVDEAFVRRKREDYGNQGRGPTLLEEYEAKKYKEQVKRTLRDDGKIIRALGYSNSYYKYSGERTEKTAAFNQLSERYGEILSELLTDLYSTLSGFKIDAFPQQFLTDVLLLKDSDLAGIEKINSDLGPLYNYYKNKQLPSLSAEKYQKAKQGTSIGAGVAALKYENSQDAKLQQERLNDVINAQNQLKESRSSGDGGYVSDLLDEASETLLSDFRDGVTDRLRAYTDLSLNDYNKKIYDFLDTILRDSNMLALPQFDRVRELLKNNRMADTDADCYPDFPMKEVLSLMKDDETLATYLTDGLYKAWEELGLGVKNVGVSSLLNPDFYFYNHTVDALDDILPYHVINKAKDTIIAGRQAQKNAEKDWFTGIYRSQVVGAEKNQSILQKAVTWIGSIFGGGGEDDEKKRPQNIQNYTDAYAQYLETNGVAPDGLHGVVGPSIYEAELSSEPVQCKAIQSANADNNEGEKRIGDVQNVYSNYRRDDVFKSTEQSSVVQHRFDTEQALSFLPESSYVPPPAGNVFDPNKEPSFIPPTDTTARRITSRYGDRKPPNRVKAIREEYAGKPDIIKEKISELDDVTHGGIDIAGNTKADSRGAGIYAAEAGKIVYVRTTEPGNRGNAIHIQHAKNYYTVYQHLETESYFNSIHEAFSNPNMPEDLKNRLLTVAKGQQIGVMGTTGPSTGLHLHFEIRQGGNDKKSRIDPLTKLDAEKKGGMYRLTGAGEYKSQGPILGIDPENESLLYKSVKQFEKSLKGGMGYGMMRAFPTFKLYFIESDLGERKRYAFDDFFAYNAVQEIQVVRHRKIAADLCVIQLTNVSGTLSNRKFVDAKNQAAAFGLNGEVVEEKDDAPGETNTVDENPIASLMLQSGIQVQLKLGYTNNPEELETVFNGVIVEHEFSESTDMVTIICQSFAIELVQTIQGIDKSFGGWFTDNGRTWHILNEVLAAPEVVHFGRWEAGGFGKNAARGLLKSRWQFKPNPKDDNLFPPPGSYPRSSVNILSYPYSAIMGSNKFIMYNTTIWDTIQELTYRHPSYIASAVPYEGEYGPRMTMFFGLPDQLYFARDPYLEETNIINNLKKVVKDGATDDLSEQQRQDLQDSTLQLDEDDARKLQNATKQAEEAQSVEETDIWLKKVAKQFALARGFIKPFRNYHVATSSLHIISNNISSSGHNTFNTVTLQYSDDEPEVDEDTRQLAFDDPETFTLKADAGVPDEEIREMFAQYPNCVGYEMAKQYSLSLLYQSLKEAYGGSLIMVGNPGIKPYDIIYVFDEYSDMFGPIEVEKVVHKFSQQTGFVTEVTPDLCVHVNQESTMSTQDAMGLIAEHALQKIGMESLSTVVQAGEEFTDAINTLGISPLARMFFNQSENAVPQNQEQSVFGAIGTFIFRKLVTRTQLAHPFRYSPLVLSGKPMIGGLPNRYTDGSFIQRGEKWLKEAGKALPLYIDDTYEHFKANYWFGNSEGEFKTIFFGEEQ